MRWWFRGVPRSFPRMRASSSRARVSAYSIALLFACSWSPLASCGRLWNDNESHAESRVMYFMFAPAADGLHLLENFKMLTARSSLAHP